MNQFYKCLESGAKFIDDYINVMKAPGAGDNIRQNKKCIDQLSRSYYPRNIRIIKEHPEHDDFLCNSS